MTNENEKNILTGMFEEEKLHSSLRPSNFKEYIGQEKLKDKLRIHIEAATARGEVPDHILLYGPPGLGKTTIAQVIASELGVNMKTTSGPVLKKAGDLAAILMSLQEGDILFIDEIHRLNYAVEEILYPAMEDIKIDLIIGKGPSARSLQFELSKFTLIAATTRASLLTFPLRDRFGLVQRLDFYGQDDLFTIIKRNAELLSVAIDEESAKMIAGRSRGTPRIANRLLKRVRDYAQIKAKGSINKQICKDALDVLEIDDYGLEELDRNILRTIIAKYNGGPAGIESISLAIGEDRRTVEEIHEPYLIQLGLLKRTVKGRVVTELGLSHMRDI